MGRFQTKGETGQPCQENRYHIDMATWSAQWPSISAGYEAFHSHPTVGINQLAGEWHGVQMMTVYLASTNVQV